MDERKSSIFGNILLGKFGPKNQYRQFNPKFGTQTNLNMSNLMVMFTFSVFDWKYPFWENLVPKLKTIVQSEIGTQTYLNIQNSIVLFAFFYFRLKISFLGKFGSKNPNCQVKLKFGTQTNSNMQNSIIVFTFPILYHKYFWGASLVQKIQTVSLS